MYRVDKLPAKLEIGCVGETNFRKIEIDLAPWLLEYPTGVPSMRYVKPGKTNVDAYTVATVYMGGVISWTPTSDDIGDKEGFGSLQIILEITTDNSEVSVIGKSAVVQTVVKKGIEVDGTVYNLDNIEELIDYLTDRTEAAEAMAGTAITRVQAEQTRATAAENTKVAKADIANDLTTTAEGKVLDARQGKELKDQLDNKVGLLDVVNNCTTTEEGKVLDARQGKVLMDGKIDKPSGVVAGKYLQTDTNGVAVWGDAADPTTISNTVGTWLENNLTQSENYIEVTQSLTIPNAAADAKAVGDAINTVMSAVQTEATARTNADNDLKSAFETGIEKVNGARVYVFEPGYINLGMYYIGDVVSLSVTSNATTNHIVIECNAGDKFTVNLKGGASARAYAVLDSDKKLLYVTGYNDDYSGTITIPSAGAYLVMNTGTSIEYFAYKNPALKSFVDEMKLDLYKSSEESIEDFSVFDTVNATINGSVQWATGTSYTSCFVKVGKGHNKSIKVKSNADRESFISLLKNNTVGTSGATVTTFATGETGRRTIPANTVAEINAPDDCLYVFVTLISSGNSYTPQYLKIQNTEIVYDDMIDKLDRKIEGLDDRIDEEVSDIEDEFGDLDNAIGLTTKSFVNGIEQINGGKIYTFEPGYINLGMYYVGDVVSLTVTPNESTIHTVIKCNSNEEYTVKLKGGASARAYAILDADKKLITVTGYNQSFFGTVTIPSNGKYLVLNTDISVEYYAYKEPGLKRIVESLKNTKDNYASRVISVNANNHDIPQNKGVLNAYKKAHQMKDIIWNALSAVPSILSATGIPAGNHTGLPYSSVKEYDKYIGWNVSLRTFMTAVHNPYSLLYTEDVNGERSTSGYGITYHGINCGSYFGIVCNIFVLYALGWDIPWNTAEFAYLYSIGKLNKEYDQSATGMRLMDIVWEPGHGNIILDIERDSYGQPVYIWWAESTSPYPVINKYTPAEVNERLNDRGGIIYYAPDLYKNLDYTPSPFVAVMNENPDEYTYNDDICTFAGDYACFNDDEDVWINYTAGSYTALELYKNDTLLSTTSIDPSLHKIKITTDGYGKYKARLKNGSNYSDYTYFEIVDTTVTASYSGGFLTVNFSSENADPVYAQLTYRDGRSRGIIELTQDIITDGTCIIDPYELLSNQYPGGTFEQTTYIKVFFKGDYGVVPNAYVNSGIV